MNKTVDCESVLEQLSEYIDQETRDELCAAIQQHLAACRDCQVKVDTVRKTIVLYQAGQTIEVPMRASERLSAALAAEYGQGGEPRRTD